MTEEKGNFYSDGANFHAPSVQPDLDVINQEPSPQVDEVVVNDASAEFAEAQATIIFSSPHEKQARVQEQDMRIQKYGAFLAGIWEAGGSEKLSLEHRTFVSASGGRKSAGDRVYPVLGFADNRPERMDKIASFFGGGLSGIKNLDHSKEWSLTKRKANILVESMRPFAPSREEFAIACENLGNAEDLEEKKEILKDTQGVNRYAGVSIDQYADVVRNPLFIAGVFVGRGLFVYRHDYTTRPTINISTENFKLREALRREYGGHHNPSADGYSDEELELGITPGKLTFNTPESDVFMNIIDTYIDQNLEQDPDLLVIRELVRWPARHETGVPSRQMTQMALEENEIALTASTIHSLFVGGTGTKVYSIYLDVKNKLMGLYPEKIEQRINHRVHADIFADKETFIQMMLDEGVRLKDKKRT